MMKRHITFIFFISNVLCKQSLHKDRAEEDTHCGIESFSLKFLPVSILSFFLLTIYKQSLILLMANSSRMFPYNYSILPDIHLSM